jgi:aminoglycoside 6'-N-acetyltransferase I
MGPTPRPLQPGDRDEWLRMRRELFPDCSEQMHAYEMGRHLSAPGARAVVVLDRGDGSLGGFVEVAERERVDGTTADRVAYLEAWFVDRDLRGHGFGGRLMREAEEWARSRGLAEIASDTAIDDEDAIAAHWAAGFRETFRVVMFLKRLEGE